MTSVHDALAPRQRHYGGRAWQGTGAWFIFAHIQRTAGEPEGNGEELDMTVKVKCP